MPPSSPPQPHAIDLTGLEVWITDRLNSRDLPEQLHEAVVYALLGPGKRVRPVLCGLSARACGGSAEQAWPAAASVEMIHAFSLVHDDLPAMDDDDLRRGRPTVHKKFDEALAILAGDALVSLAFESLAVHSGGDASGAGRAGRLVSELALATTDMVSGQVDDTMPDFDSSMSDLARLERVHRRKTGALLRASCRMGALSVDADAEQLDAVSRFGEAAGLMFQVVDDLIDATVDSAEAGKRTGKDAEAGKLTYPGVLGIEASRAKVVELETAALDALAPLGDTAEPLREWCRWLAVRRS